MTAARGAFTIVMGAESPSIRARRVAALAADGVDVRALAAGARALAARGATVQLVAPRPGVVKTASGGELRVDLSLITTRSLPFDAVFVPDGPRSVRDLRWDPRAWVFLTEACEQGKPFLAVGHGVELFDPAAGDRLAVCAADRVVLAPRGATPDATHAFIAAIATRSDARARRTPAVAVATI
jgi:catalase